MILGPTHSGVKLCFFVVNGKDDVSFRIIYQLGSQWYL